VYVALETNARRASTHDPETQTSRAPHEVIVHGGDASGAASTAASAAFGASFGASGLASGLAFDASSNVSDAASSIAPPASPASVLCEASTPSDDPSTDPSGYSGTFAVWLGAGDVLSEPRDTRQPLTTTGERRSTHSGRASRPTRSPDCACPQV
jgi:hypothetical protein